MPHIHTSEFLSHPLGQQLINWHRKVHNLDIQNIPTSTETIFALDKLVSEILIPIEQRFGFGMVNITYGFTSLALKKVIAKRHSANTAPSLDQHASCELNGNDNLVCVREGAACDFLVSNVASSLVAQFVINELNYDRIYFYGTDRPLHVSVSSHQPTKHLQIMARSKSGRRYPSLKAFGEEAKKLVGKL